MLAKTEVFRAAGRLEDAARAAREALEDLRVEGVRTARRLGRSAPRRDWVSLTREMQ